MEQVLTSRGSQKNKVLSETYKMLGISMLQAAVGAKIGMMLSFSFASSSPLLFAIGGLVLMMGLMFAVSALKDSVYGIMALLAFTGVSGILMGPMLNHTLSLSNGSTLVGMAAMGTAVIMFAMSILAGNVKGNLDGLGRFLFAGLITLLIASVANLFFQVPLLALALSGVAVLLFSAYLMYDLHRIINGGETDYIMATLAVYLSLYNIFVNLLQLLSVFMGERD